MKHFTVTCYLENATTRCLPTVVTTLLAILLSGNFITSFTHTHTHTHTHTLSLSLSLSLSLQTAAPKRWIAYDGNTTEMATPYTLRAAQLRDLYHSLTNSALTSDERLDILLTLKCTVKV